MVHLYTGSFDVTWTQFVREWAEASTLTPHVRSESLVLPFSRLTLDESFFLLEFKRYKHTVLARDTVHKAPDTIFLGVPFL